MLPMNIRREAYFLLEIMDPVSVRVKDTETSETDVFDATVYGIEKHSGSTRDPVGAVMVLPVKKRIPSVIPYELPKRTHRKGNTEQPDDYAFALPMRPVAVGHIDDFSALTIRTPRRTVTSADGRYEVTLHRRKTNAVSVAGKAPRPAR